MWQQPLSEVQSLFDQARHLFRCGQYQECLHQLEPHLASGEADVRGRAVLFTIASMRRLHMLDQALKLIADQLPVLPDAFHPPLLLDRASILSLQGKWELAGQYYSEFISQYGADSEWAGECYRGAAWCSMQLGRYQESLFYAAKAVQLLARNDQFEGLMAAHVDMSQILMALGRPQQARRSLERALRFLPQVAHAPVRLRALIHLTRWELDHGTVHRAAAVLDQVWAGIDPASPACRPEHAWCLLLHARLLSAQGERRAALAEARRGLQVASTLADAVELRRELARVLRSVQI